MLIMNCLDYNPETGIFVWEAPSNRRIKRGSVAGTKNPDGYITIGINGALHRAHHLAWEAYNGDIPEGFMIDHKNRIRHDNTLSNLRLATRQQNNQNSPDRYKKDGLPRNIRKVKRGYSVKLKIDKVYSYFGVYEDLELAIFVENMVREKYHGDFISDI